MRVPAFSSLRARLTAQYAGLFAAAMILLSGALYITTERIASTAAGSQLASSGAVYDRLWAERSQQLQQASGLLAKDFGFRAAVATGDARTAASALDNLRSRLGVRSAFILDADGHATTGSELPDQAQADALWIAFDDGRLVGVATISGRPRQVVAAPILAPQLLGWIVFTVDIDQRQMSALESLSPVPIVAGVVARRGDGAWTRLSGHFADLDTAESRRVDAELDRGAALSPTIWRDQSFAVVRALPTLAPGERAALVLLYPKDRAMAAYRPIQWATLLFALLGVTLVVIASWRTAARITRPLARLDEAARRLAEGKHDEVAVTGSDELARLSASFNTMVGEIEQRERQVRHLSFNDFLTGLPNRVMFREHAELLLRRRESDEGELLALMCIGLDDFKAINDTLGHEAGDRFLQTTAARILAAAGGAFVARLGGDEFVVFGSYGQAQAIEARAAHLLAEIRKPVVIEGHEILAGASLGIGLAGQDGEDLETLLRSADLALHRAKDAGRGGVCFFKESFNERAQARRRIEADLRRAVERGEFQLLYQPLHTFGDHRITAFEALIRWHHPQRGTVSPLEFIPVAEETGMIVEIGAWVLREACRFAASWPNDVRVAVNVSSVQIHRPGLGQIVVQALAASGLAPNRLELEITESVFLDDSAATLEVLHALKALGVRIALDDFGTGYSSLSYLQSFPFDKLKIDRSFIVALENRPGALAVIRAITDLAGALGMETTAEGVEDLAQLNQLEDQGCTTVQGFLFSRPVDEADVRELLGISARVRRTA